MICICSWSARGVKEESPPSVRAVNKRPVKSPTSSSDEPIMAWNNPFLPSGCSILIDDTHLISMLRVSSH
jgi:hypothetical protein